MTPGLPASLPFSVGDVVVLGKAGKAQRASVDAVFFRSNAGDTEYMSRVPQGHV